MPWLMLLLAPGFASDPGEIRARRPASRASRFPISSSCRWSRSTTGILNAFGRFAIAAFAPTLLNVVLIAVLLVFVASGGDDQSTAGTSLAWGIAVSGLLQVLVVGAAAAKYRHAPCRGSVRNSPPRCGASRRSPCLASLPAAWRRSPMVISTIIATLQDRVVSWLYYADRLFQLPLGVIGVAIGVVLLPTLSHKLRSGDHAAVLASENRALEFALLLTLPAAIALFLAAEPIMRVLFERGAFTAVDTKATASMLAALALGLPAYVLDQGPASELLRPRGHEDADDLCRHQPGGECGVEPHAVPA